MDLVPFRSEWPSMSRLQNRMNRLLEDFFTNGDEWSSEATFAPSLDIVDAEDAIEVRAELPGVRAEDIDIQVHDDILSIKGEKKWEKEEKGKTWHRRECRTGSFFRSIRLPSKVDADHIKASEQNGILSITLPKAPEAKAKKIEVKSKK